MTIESFGITSAPSCFGEYQPEGACFDCCYAQLCEAEAIARDAYWDHLSDIATIAEEYEQGFKEEHYA